MRQVKVKVLTKNNLQISGELRTSLPVDAYHDLISDLFKNSRTFIDLFNVTVYSNGQLLTKIPFLCINKPAIAFLSEEEFARTSGGRLTSPFAC